MQSVTSNAVAQALSYSETEYQVGYWIDGSILYRKVLVHRIPSNGNYNIPLGVNNAKVRNWRGNFFQISVEKVFHF